jgi:hypothetical protein
VAGSSSGGFLLVLAMNERTGEEGSAVVSDVVSHTHTQVASKAHNTRDVLLYYQQQVAGSVSSSVALARQTVRKKNVVAFDYRSAS